MSKVIGIYVTCQMLVCFTITTQQIWSFQPTQVASFENVLFCPNSTFNIRKSHKISSGNKCSLLQKLSAKTSRGVETTHPVPLGLSRIMSTQTYQLNCVNIVVFSIR